MELKEVINNTVSMDTRVGVLEMEETTLTGREAYLDWMARWKALYAEISQTIRAVKGMRKEFRYAYREPGENEKPRRVKIGPNPNHKSDWRVQAHRDELRSIAAQMMELRAAAKASGIARAKRERESFEAA